MLSELQAPTTFCIMTGTELTAWLVSIAAKQAWIDV